MPSKRALQLYAQVGSLPGPDHIERCGVKLAVYGRVHIEARYADRYEKARKALIEIGRLTQPPGCEAKYLAALEDEAQPKLSVILYDLDPKTGRARSEPALARVLREAGEDVHCKAGDEVSAHYRELGRGSSRQFVIYSPLNKGMVTCTGGLRTPLSTLVHELAHAARRYRDRCGAPPSLTGWTNEEEYAVINKIDNALASLRGEGLRASHGAVMDYEVAGFEDDAPLRGSLEPHLRELFDKHRRKIEFQKRELFKLAAIDPEHWGIGKTEERLAKARRKFADALREEIKRPPSSDAGGRSRLGALDPRRWCKPGR